MTINAPSAIRMIRILGVVALLVLGSAIKSTELSIVFLLGVVLLLFGTGFEGSDGMNV